MQTCHRGPRRLAIGVPMQQEGKCDICHIWDVRGEKDVMNHLATITGQLNGIMGGYWGHFDEEMERKGLPPVGFEKHESWRYMACMRDYIESHNQAPLYYFFKIFFNPNESFHIRVNE